MPKKKEAAAKPAAKPKPKAEEPTIGTVLAKAAKTAAVKPAEPKKEEPPAAVAPKPDPVADLGPNATYPYGIKLTAPDGAISYERHKTKTARDRRLKLIPSQEPKTTVEALDHESVQPAPTATSKGAQALQEIAKGKPAIMEIPAKPTLVPSTKGKGRPDKVDEAGNVVSRRITPGTPIKDWRIARSVRIDKPGFFVQGGCIEVANGRKHFRVAVEEHYTNLHKAKEAWVNKYPAEDDTDMGPADNQPSIH